MVRYCQSTPVDFSQPLALAEMGSFHVGGREITLRGKERMEIDVNKDSGRRIDIDPNGEYHVEQMYAQYFIPAGREGRFPLTLWHGGGLTGVTYETTPDGRPGWRDYFLRRGWAVCAGDAVERGRSGWAPQHELFRREEPVLVTKRYAFERYRIGPDYGTRRPFDGSRFPMEAYDRMMMQFVPRWTDTTQATIDAYTALLRRCGPSVVVAHSQGASLAFRIAEAAPELVKALVAVEPYAVGREDHLPRIAGIPMLLVLGDHMEDHPAWAQSKALATGYFDKVRAAGGRAEVMDLPAMGVPGNSHMMMMETNSLEIAESIHCWLADQGLWGS